VLLPTLYSIESSRALQRGERMAFGGEKDATRWFLRQAKCTLARKNSILTPALMAAQCLL
jgi:hypothetical protein